MIGKVALKLAGKSYDLVLGIDGLWSCSEWPDLAAALTQAFEAYDRSGSLAIAGHHQIHLVATRFNGRAVFPDHGPEQAITVP